LNNSVKIIFSIQCFLALIGALLGSYFQYAVHIPHTSDECKDEFKSGGDVSMECQYDFYLDLPAKMGHPAGKVL